MSEEVLEQRGGLFAVRPGYNLFKRDYWLGQVDSRPLSVFRIVFGLLLLKDAFYHLFIARIFYSDKGVVPLSAMHSLVRDSRFSLMDAIAQPWLVVLFFALWCVVLVLLISGYRSRLMSILNFIILLSVHERNIWVLNGADTVMRVLSFWLMFLPLGHYYSLDVIRRRWSRFRLTRRLADLRSPEADDAPPGMAFAFPLRLIQLQVGLIYLFTFLLKLPIREFAPWQQGTALFYALQLKSLTQLPGDLFFQFAPFWTLKALDYFTLIVEGTFFLFVFSPLFQPVLRKAGLLGVMLLHVGIGVMMSIPNFSMVMISSYLTFFESGWLLEPGKRWRGPAGQVNVSTPGAGSPLWLLLPATRASEIAPDDALMAEGNGPDDWAASAGDQPVMGEAAWRLVAGHMPLSKLWAWTLRYGWLRRLVWASAGLYIERYPSVQPDPQAQPLPHSHRWTGAWRTLSFAVTAFFMFGVVWLNLRSLDLDESVNFGQYYESGAWADIYSSQTYNKIYQASTTPVRFVGLWQEWSMFSPFPSTVDGWMVAPGKFEDDTQIDLLTGESLHTGWHRWFFGPDMRWKKYESNMNRMEDIEPLLSAWGSYFCDEYNNDKALPEGERLATMEFHFYWYRSYDPGGEPGEMNDDLKWKHWCYSEYAY